MAVRTALLTSRNINLDTDFSKYIESVTTAGIISGFTVTASNVAAGTAWVPCTRTNGDTIYALVQNFSAVTISGNGHVIIKVDDTIVDNGGGNEDGTGIATISVVDTLPSKNYLELATISSGTVTTVAPTIKKLGELDTEIQSLFARMSSAEDRIEALEEAWAINHLEESGLVWELYTLNDTLFKQYAPTLANSTLTANVGDVAANTEIHIQAMGSGEASNTLKLKVKMAGSPTTSLKVEVREWVQVTVTANTEAYRYGNSSKILATGTLASSSFSSNWAEVTFTLDNAVGGTKGQLLDVVVYQTTGSGATVNASNYYVLACDSTQYSEAFGYVSVNGNTRSRSKLMPYLSSVWFVQAMLCKVKNTGYYANQQILYNQTIDTSISRDGILTVINNQLFKNSNFAITWDSLERGAVITLVIDNNYKTWSWYSTDLPYFTIPYEDNLTANANHTVQFYNWRSGSQNFKITNCKMFTYSDKIDGTVNNVIKGVSNLVKHIWEQAIYTIFWVKPNGEREYWPVGKKEFSTTATTGSITPWNYKGYLTIQATDGNIYKVWVYDI